MSTGASRDQAAAVARRATLAIAATIFAVSIAAVAALTGPNEADGRLNGPAAERAALEDPGVRGYLARYPQDRYRAIPLDEKHQRITFYDGQRALLDVAVDPSGNVTSSVEYPPNYVWAGSRTLQRPPLALLLFCAVFALATLRLPLWSIRTLDVAVLLSFAAQAVLLNEALFAISVVVSTLALGYLAARCLTVALRPSPTVDPGETLIERILARGSSDSTLRRIGLVIGAITIAVVLLSIPAGRVGDVGFASSAGATLLLDGVLPYGNITSDIVHGDTYPLLAYAIYIPVAIFMPVHDLFSNAEGALYVSTAAALIAAAGMYLAGNKLGGRDRTAGALAALAWLSFPPVVLCASSGPNDLPVAAFTAWSLALSRHGTASTALLAVAGWMKVVPLLTLPALLARLRGAALARALAAVATISVACAIWLIALDGFDGIREMVRGISFQARRGSPLTIWYLVDARFLQVALQAAALTIALMGGYLVWRDRRLADDIRRVAALGAGTMLTMLLAANFFTWAYLPWVFPFVAAALLMPARRITPPAR